MNKVMIALAVLGALAMGCGKGDDKAGGDGKTSTGAAAGGGDKIGVQECDDYIAKMEACFAKDPATKAASEPGLKTMRDAWKQAAAQGGAAKDGLKQGCTAAAANLPANCK